MPLALNFLLLVLLFMFSAFFAAAETSLFSLSKLERRRLEERHPRAARWVIDHLDHPRRTLVTILIGNLFVHVLAAAVVTLVSLETWGPRGTGLAVVLFAVLLILAGEITPKILAVRKNEALALATAFPLRVFSVLIFPLRRLTRWVTDWILRFLIREKTEHPDRISEEEFKTLLKIGEEEGVLDRQERHMIQKIFELGERPVKAIMTPRIDVAALDAADSREKHIEAIRKFHFSHFPVYQESLDHILGVVSVQEYMLDPGRDIPSLLKQPLFVPETKRIDDLLAEFRRKDQNFAVCVDEYGGTAGIVTLEDVLEEVFGEFYDEYAKVENPIRPLGHEEFFVEAKIPLAEFNDYFSTRLEAEAATTLGGFILEKLGEVPEKGKVLQAADCDIRIHEVIRHRIKSVVVRPRS